MLPRLRSVLRNTEKGELKMKKLVRGELYWTVVAVVLLALLAGSVFKEAAQPTALAVATEASPKPVVEPVNLGSVINTNLRQAEVSFTADGKTMYFNCQLRPGRAGNDICVSRLIGTLEDGRWTTPEIVAPGVISLTDTFDVEPLISADGKTLYFQSDRPGGHGGGRHLVQREPRRCVAVAQESGPAIQQPAQ